MNLSDETTWPPPPKPTEPPPITLRVEAVEVTRTVNTLTVRNHSAFQALWMSWAAAIIIPLFQILLPMLVLGHESSRELSLRHYFTFLYYREPAMLCFSIFTPVYLLLMGWVAYNFTNHRGLYILDRETAWVRMGGDNAYPLSEIKNVVMKRPIPFLMPKWRVWFIGANLIPRVHRHSLRAWGQSSQIARIGIFRKEADARRVAEAIADFVGVPVAIT